MFAIIVSDNSGHSSTHTFGDDVKEVNVGRGDDNDIPLPLGNVSMHHCRLKLTSGGFVVLDLGSTNGTFVNDHQVTSAQVLRPSDVVRIGHFTLIVDSNPDVPADDVPLPATVMADSGIISGGKRLPLVAVEIQASILGPCATVKVTQHYRVERGRAMDAVYVFPLERGAVLTHFSARMPGRLVKSQVQAGPPSADVPFTFHRQRPDILVAGLGNLDEGEIIVEVAYAQALEVTGSALRFAIPVSHAPEAAAVITSGRGLKVAVDLHIEPRLNALASPTHPWRFEGDGSRWQATFDSLHPGLDEDLVLLVTPRHTDKPTAWLVRAENGEQMAMIHHRPLQPQVRTPRELIFLVDCSSIFQGQAFDQARRVLATCLQNMEEGDAFNVIWFGGHCESLWASSVDNAPETIADALGAVEKVTATLGGKDLLAALRHAFETPADPERARCVVALTDGGTGAAEEMMALAARYKDHTGLILCGIHARGNAYLLGEAARAAGGTAFFLDPGERAETIADTLLSHARGPALTDVRVAWGRLEVEQAPAVCPNVHAGEDLRIFARVTSGHSQDLTLIAGDRSWSVPLHALNAPAEPAIRALWAHAAIGDLEERLQRQSGPLAIQTRSQIVGLSTSFGVLSGATHLNTASDRPILITSEWQDWSPARPRVSRALPALRFGPTPQSTNPGFKLDRQHTAPQTITDNVRPNKASGRISYEDADGVTRTVVISRDFPEVTLGRNPGSVIKIGNLTVSRAHARFMISGDTCTLYDLNSSHGSYVNGEKITTHVLQDGDLIRCGDFPLRFEWDDVPAPQPGLPKLPSLTAENLQLDGTQDSEHDTLRGKLEQALAKNRAQAGRIETLQSEIDRTKEEHRQLIRDLHKAQSALREAPGQALFEDVQSDLALTRQERDRYAATLEEIRGSLARLDPISGFNAAAPANTSASSLRRAAGPLSDDDMETTVHIASRAMAPTAPADWLIRLLMTQQRDGSFLMNGDLMRWLGPTYDAVTNASGLHGEAIVVTSVVITLLTREVSERESDWLSAVSRARNWLAQHPSNFDVTTVLGPG